MSATEGKQASLQKAKTAKNDEFYTRLEDIEKEVRHYTQHFKGKTVFLNCDDPYESDFFKYFAMNFEHLGLKKLISVSYARSPIVGREISLFDIAGLEDAPLPKEPYKVEITEIPDSNGDGAIDLTDVTHLLKSDKNTITMLNGDGDFRSQESVDLLKQSDIVVTNPPFSLFPEFVGQLIAHKKQFLILGNMNAVTYRDIWPLVRDERIWLGVTRTGTGSMWFRVAEDAPEKSGQKIEQGVRLQTVGSSAWFTNLDHARRHEEIPLFRKYVDDPARYPNYDNFTGIEVSRVTDIPLDYDGPMGVPITFLGKHNPDQFEIVAYSRKRHIPAEMMLNVGLDHSQPYVAGKAKYDRIFIRRKQ